MLHVLAGHSIECEHSVISDLCPVDPVGEGVHSDGGWLSDAIRIQVAEDMLTMAAIKMAALHSGPLGI